MFTYQSLPASCAVLVVGAGPTARGAGPQPYPDRASVRRHTVEGHAGARAERAAPKVVRAFCIAEVEEELGALTAHAPGEGHGRTGQHRTRLRTGHRRAVVGEAIGRLAVLPAGCEARAEPHEERAAIQRQAAESHARRGAHGSAPPLAPAGRAAEVERILARTEAAAPCECRACTRQRGTVHRTRHPSLADACACGTQPALAHVARAERAPIHGVGAISHCEAVAKLRVRRCAFHILLRHGERVGET